MGEAELRIALQREGETQIRGFWQEAEATVAAKREEIEAALTHLRTENDRLLQAEASKQRNSLLFEAQTKAMECRLHAESALEARLLILARRLLPTLAGTERAALWNALRDELPKAGWASLRINPADHETACGDFPSAEIVDEEEIAGGLIATNAEGTICVDNSLGCRLLRAWPDLLPNLMAELRKQVDNDETAQTNTTG